MLGVKEEAGRPVVEALVRFVKDRALLLILDNCEHLAHACAELALQLLQAGPHVKILASSRESLHVARRDDLPGPGACGAGSGAQGRRWTLSASTRRWACSSIALPPCSRSSG